MAKAPKERIFSLRLSDETYETLNKIAEKRMTTTADLIRMFIRLGMLAVSDDQNGPKLLLKDGDELRPIMFV
jgi:predicted DNA-binding protein